MRPLIESPAANLPMRVPSIDWVRGIAMVLMLVDHVREYFTIAQPLADPMDLVHTPWGIVVIRLFTHLCAPTFVLLAGVAVHLYSLNQQNLTSVRRYLLTRGIWLILLELTVVNFGWTFSLTFPVRYLQVIWAIGISMCALAAGTLLRQQMVGAIGLTIIVGHNFFDRIRTPTGGIARTLAALLHRKLFIPVTNSLRLRTTYPVIPWIGTMFVGYALGPLFTTELQKRSRYLWLIALCCALAFFTLRVTGIYGEQHAWVKNVSVVYSFFSLFNTTKYPPSFQFLLWTLAICFSLLAWSSDREQKLLKPLINIGRVPLFFYVVHLYVVHAVALLVALIRGYAFADVSFSTNYGGLPPNFNQSPLTIVVAAALLLLMIAPFCGRYRSFKKGQSHPFWQYV